MTKQQYDLVVFGATSFVGQITARYLANHIAEHQLPVRWAIAARSEQKLKTSLPELAGQVDCLVADANNDEDMQALAASTRVVISTVGPYALYGEPLVKACAANGTDYCDLTGETQWIKKMMDRYQAQAEQSGARLVNCCGFDSVPSDMGVYALQRAFNAKYGRPATKVKLGVKRIKGGLSGGTYASLLNVMVEASRDPAINKLMKNPYSLCPQGHPFKLRQHFVAGPSYDKHHKAWTAPFVMAAINERIVHKSNACTGASYGDNFQYHEAMLMGDGFAGRMRAWSFSMGLGLFMLGVSIPFTRKLLSQFVLPKPGEGPSPEEQLNGFFDMRVVAYENDVDKLAVKVTGDRDPGYGSTAKMLGQAGLSLLQDYHADSAKLGNQGGFWTPASMFDQRYIDRLRQFAGVNIDVLES